MARSISALFLLLLLAGCAVEPQPIRYGEDMCHFCTMTIVERGFGTEVVTTKGKAYKFDAIECMLHYMKGEEEEKIALYLTSLLTAPGELHDATSAVFVRSESIPSPMGAFLSAYADRASAERVLGEEPGEIYDWEGLRSFFDTFEQ